MQRPGQSPLGPSTFSSLERPRRYRTRVYRVAGGNYTTKPPLQQADKLFRENSL